MSTAASRGTVRTPRPTFPALVGRGVLTAPLRMVLARFCLATLFFSSFLVPCFGSDWPQFLGPTRNGVYTGPTLAASWPKEGPRVVWQRKVGAGFSGPAVSSGKLILFHRIDDKETIECLDSSNGKSLWSFDYPTAYRDDFGFDEGPRATPAIADGHVYTYGAEGVLTCLDVATGKKVWSVDAKKDFHTPKGFFGIACSPLVEGNSVILNVGGGDGVGIVAFDKLTGKILWKVNNDQSSYSSPVAATISNRRYLFVLTLANFVGLDPVNGKILFQYPFRPPIHASVTAAAPLVVDDQVFISASYGLGAALLKITANGPEKTWSGDDILSNHYVTSVYLNGFLFGIHGRTDPGFEPSASLRCVELKTGKVRWQEDNFGAATLTLAGDQLFILTEKGELIRAPATPSSFKPLDRAQVLPTQVRAHPALADGFFYVRSKDKLVCLDLR